MSDVWLLIDRTLLEKALEELTNCNSEYGHRCTRCDSEIDEGGKVAAALRAALAQEEQREQDARAEQIMSEIWAQPDQTYEYIGAKLAENMKKAMKNRARVSIEAVRSALEQDEREPVGWLESPHGAFRANLLYRMTAPQSIAWSIPVYITLPRREWQGLTDEDVGAIRWGCRWNTMSTDDSMILTTKDQVDAFARAVEAKLKERNHE
jgi:hypothetical protein